MIAADLISKQQRLEERNQIALIVLDSTLEIAFKEYLVNESGTAYSNAKLLSIFGNRIAVHDEVKKYVKIKDDTWGKIKHYYDLRCKLVHEKATGGVSDPQIQDFREVVEGVLTKLYKLKFDEDQARGGAWPPRDRWHHAPPYARLLPVVPSESCTRLVTF